MSDQTKTTRIVLGASLAEIELPDSQVIYIRRMSANKEARFIALYNDFISAIEKSKDKIMLPLQDAMGGAQAMTFGLFDAAKLAGNVLQDIPALQEILHQGVQIVLESNGIEISTTEIGDLLATADSFEILSKQAEVQGLLTSFRGLLAGLSSSGVGQG